MTDKDQPLLEIDGMPTEYDGLCDEDWLTDVPMCGITGANETTKPGDKIRNFLSSGKMAWLVNVRHINPDGTRFGMTGIFARGEWVIADNGRPLCRVWDRIA